eukprot:6371474-Amphidinium_carterae.1
MKPPLTGPMVSQEATRMYLDLVTSWKGPAVSIDKHPISVLFKFWCLQGGAAAIWQTGHRGAFGL